MGHRYSSLKSSKFLNDAELPPLFSVSLFTHGTALLPSIRSLETRGRLSSDSQEHLELHGGSGPNGDICQQTHSAPGGEGVFQQAQWAGLAQGLRSFPGGGVLSLINCLSP